MQEPRKPNWLGRVALILALAAFGHSCSAQPPAKPRPLLRVVDWAAWLWSTPLRRDAGPPEADEPRRLAEVPHQHIADNQPPVRAMGPSGEPVIDHGHGW